MAEKSGMAGTRRAFLDRAFLGVGFGAAAAVLTPQANAQQQGQAGEGGLRDRGAPTGRTGAATRGGDRDTTLDLVAPLRGVGLTAADQPELCYVLSGRAAEPPRLAVSAPGQARPWASLALPRVPSSGLGVVRLRDHGVRLPPNLLCAWSLTVATNPRSPSRDLVASALIQYRLGGPGLDAMRAASLDGRVEALVRAGYWYDAAALAEQGQGSDRGAALAWLFRQADLRLASASDRGAAR